MQLYTTFSSWYRLLTPVSEYEEEAAEYLSILDNHLPPGRHRLLELGAGAGHNAFYFQPRFDLHLTDVSPEMLALAQDTCPEATCTVGDMRTVRLGQTFDVVFIHDAICYMRTIDDLRQVFKTARVHLRPGGLLMVGPDAVAETFRPSEDVGGHDSTDGEPRRALRYLEWCWQRPGQTDGYVVDYTLVTRINDDPAVILHDRHEEGLFPRAVWRQLLEEAGFELLSADRHDPDFRWELDLFLGRLRD